MSYVPKRGERAIGFYELVEYGLRRPGTGSIVRGRAWSFSWQGISITHHTDLCYLVASPLALEDGLRPDGRFTPGDMLVTDERGARILIQVDSDRPPMMHELKTDPDLWDDVDAMLKLLEIRFNDRFYRVGDILMLRKTRYSGHEMRGIMPLEYVGEPIYRRVTHIMHGPAYGLGKGWVLMSIVPSDPTGMMAEEAKLRQSANMFGLTLPDDCSETLSEAAARTPGAFSTIPSFDQQDPL